jgi:hypothetical protein
MPASAQTAWPEVVIARYLNLGGATVDVTETGPRDSRLLHSTVAACSGCPASDRSAWEDGHYDCSGTFHPMPREASVRRAEYAAREWAQAHAEKCRAMPRPTA